MPILGLWVRARFEHLGEVLDGSLGFARFGEGLSQSEARIRIGRFQFEQGVVLCRGS